MSGQITGRINAPWMSRAAVDMQCNSFTLGDKFVKANSSGRSVSISICTVTRISDEGRIYADHSKVPIMYPGRCLIVTSIIK